MLLYTTLETLHCLWPVKVVGNTELLVPLQDLTEPKRMIIGISCVLHAQVCAGSLGYLVGSYLWVQLWILGGDLAAGA